ncbi:hypothetical protein ANN_16475 [Periplaneta americana]|uniref:UMA domain-containing protein n=1 Tax=Periplaneta americana TaxID=6978 RepID=A0ABQ8SJ28_PERAM|nr:hypothetical protein ANN_16475 [Periplaneta americana]
MSPGSSTESCPAFARIGLRENPGKTSTSTPMLQMQALKLVASGLTEDFDHWLLLNTVEVVYVMSLSWFFGSKKKTPEPDPSSEGRGEEYIFVEKKDNVQLVTGSTGPSPYPQLPYALLAQNTLAPPTPSSPCNVVTNSMSQNQNFLYGVPFKLSPETSITNDSVTKNIIQANEILSHITQLNMESFEYDFLVERSVVLEQRERELG